MAGVETLAGLAGIKIPEPVRFALNPTAYILGEIYKKIEKEAGIPENTLSALTDPGSAIKDYVKTEAGNSFLGQSNTSKLEQIINELQPNMFEQARAAGQTPDMVPSSITVPDEPDQLIGMGGIDLPSLFGYQAPDVVSGQGNNYESGTYETPNFAFNTFGGIADLRPEYAEMANGGFIYRGGR
jgi:hypothetical protein